LLLLWMSSRFEDMMMKRLLAMTKASFVLLK
jgi:hypothetical protein